MVAIHYKRRQGFTLVELLVAISIISILTAIMMPVLGKVRRQANALLCLNNQRQIASAANLFAFDNDDKYPESVATIGFGNYWNWQEPTMMTACRPRNSAVHRSMSAYLRFYIKDASIMSCPSAPYKYEYYQQAWDAGDDWDNPETIPMLDPLIGTYCFYWNYVGYLGQYAGIFRGPMRSAGGQGQSRLLLSDYFGYDHWRSRNAYGSCEKFRGADITLGTSVSSAYWSRPNPDGEVSLDTLKIKLHAGYTDGHVETFSPSEVVPMRVSITADGSVPYPQGVGPGLFYLPKNALH